MCQIRQGIIPTTAPATTSTPTTSLPELCTESLDKWQWIPFGSNCYKLVDESFEWLITQRICREDGIGDLVSIHSQEENNFLGQLIEDNGISTIHIGGFVKSLTDLVNDKWAWSDGTSWNYTRWYPDNPSHYDWNSFYVYLRNTEFGVRWSNIGDSGSERAFVCKTNQLKIKSNDF